MRFKLLPLLYKGYFGDKMRRYYCPGDFRPVGMAECINYANWQPY